MGQAPHILSMETLLRHVITLFYIKAPRDDDCAFSIHHPRKCARMKSHYKFSNAFKKLSLLNTTASTDVFKNTKYRARLGNMPIPQMCHSLPLGREPGGKHITHHWVPPDQKPSISVLKCCPFPGWSKPTSVTLQCQRLPPRGSCPRKAAIPVVHLRFPGSPRLTQAPVDTLHSLPSGRGSPEPAGLATRCHRPDPLFQCSLVTSLRPLSRPASLTSPEVHSSEARVQGPQEEG